MDEYKLDDDNPDEPINDLIKKESCLKNYRTLIIISIIILIFISIATIIIIFIIFYQNKNKNNNNNNNDNNNNNNDNDNNTTTPIYINPKDTYTHCIIWLHGLDNKPENFVDLFTKDIILNKINNTKIILLRAPIMKMTYNNESLTSWFDIYSFPLDSKDTYNFEDAIKSSNVVRNIIEQEVKILGDYQKIFIGGHSQGACISLFTGYNFEKLLGGIIVCSGFLFEQGEIIGDKRNLNVYLGHGDKDLAIPFEFHNETIKRIEDYEGVQKFYYPGHGHSIMEKEKKDIENFLNGLIL